MNATIHKSTLTHLQEIYFDVCDSLQGEPPERLGYESREDMMEEFKWKLEAIEEDLRAIFGDLEPNPQ